MMGRLENLAYIARGVRTYGANPVLARARGVWEIEVIVNGGARPTGMNDAFFEGKNSRVYVFHPDSNHGWTDDEAGASEVFVVHCRELPAEMAERVGPTEPLLVELNKDELRRLQLRLQEMWDVAKTGGALASLKLQQLLVEVALIGLGRMNVEVGPVDTAGRVDRALHWFEENLSANPSVEDVAREAGVSGAHLRRLFSDAKRAAPRAELKRLRMDAARRCLREGWKQAAVAQFLGFSETSAFARAFSEVCGMPPGAWLAKDRRALSPGERPGHTRAPEGRTRADR